MQMQDIGSIAEYIDQYGPLIVILAVFLALFILIITFIISQHGKTTNTTMEMNSKIIEKILNEQFEKNNMFSPQKNYDEKNIVNIFMQLNESLKEVCEYTMNKTQSDRTAIYVFHNGTHASHGLPFFKLTCICETISRYSNMNVQINTHSDVNLNMVDSIVSNLYNHSEYRIIKKNALDPGDLIFLQHTKIEDCFFHSIFDDDNNMMGFVVNAYNKTVEDHDIDLERKCLNELARSAKPVIEFSNFQKRKEEANKEE